LNAVDLQIVGPNGPIANAGADTTGKYTELARNMLGAQRALHPELNGKFAWGGYFNANGAHGLADPRTGDNRPDLMHFDLEGAAPRRTLMTSSYYRLGPTGNYGQARAGPQSSLTPPTPQGTSAASSTPTRGDPRGLRDYIRQTAQKYGIDPDVALRVAQAEGLSSFSSGIRGENSWGAFQLNTQGGMGNDFQRETGLDPRDPKNERATIDYALKRASREGWGAFHGAANTGIGRWQGINRGAARQRPAPAPAAPAGPALKPYPGVPEGADWRASRDQRPPFPPTASAADYLRGLGFPMIG
jgi:hypothetical protein